VPLGLLFDGTALPLMAGALGYSVLCLLLLRLAGPGRG